MMNHAHVDAALFSTILTIIIYAAKWIFGLSFPATVFILPTFMAVWTGAYLVLYFVFLWLWRKS